MNNLPVCIIGIIKNYVIFKPKNSEALQKALQDISKYGDISNWDVSQVTNMCGMFYLSLFKGDISNWNVMSVTDMMYMFYHSIFNGDISNWNVSSGLRVHDFACLDNDRSRQRPRVSFRHVCAPATALAFLGN